MAQDNCRCRGGVVVVTCPTDCPDTPEISLNSINLSGVGVLDSWNGTLGNFRGVVSGNAMATVTLDSVNHTIVVTPVASDIASALPTATTTQVGVAETATDAEAQAKAATDKFVTPSNFAALGASTTQSGFIEIATLPEVQAGTATNLAVVPDTLADMLFFSVANGANTVMGSGSSATITMNGGALLTFGGDASGTVLFYQNTLQFTDAIMNFGNATIQIGGGSIPNRMVGAGATGLAEQYPVAEFLSGYNLNTGWSAFANASVLKTCDVNTVTLPQLASIVNTLRVAISALQLPAA